MSSTHARRTAHRATNGDESDSTASSYDSSPDSSDTADSDAELYQEDRRSGNHSKKGIDQSKKTDSSATWILVLGVLVIVTAAIAAFFYVEQEGNGSGGLFGGSDTQSAVAAASGTLRSSDQGSEAANHSSGGTYSISASPTKTSQGGKSTQQSTAITSVDSTQPTVLSPEAESKLPSNSNNEGSPSTDTANSPAPTQTSSSSSNGSLRCKKGVGYNKAALTQQLDVCWGYNWDSVGGGLKDGVMYVPMLWGTKKLDGWEAAAQSAIDNGATHILGFNEPDLAEQADLTPSAAASIWSSAMQPLATKNVKLVSPAVSNGVLTDDGKPMGVPWMLEFFDACKGCTMDAVALHWYDKTSNLEYFQNYLEQAHANLSKPIWLTEFMGTGSAADQVSFIDSSVEWLEKQDYIEAYAAFGDFCDNSIANFVDCEGKPNELGSAYSSAT